MSLDAERARIEAWSDATGATLTDVVEDGGVSGTLPLGDRPGGAEIAALLDARRANVDAVVVVRLDRLGRDAAETLAVLKRFADGTVGLVSIADRLNLSTPQGRAMAGVAAVFSQLERDLIAQRTAEALGELRSQRRIYGPVPFGYRATKDRLVPHASEQNVVQRMRRMRSRRMSFDRIAQRLNADGVPAKRGGRWHAMTVRSALRTSAALETAA